MVGRRFPVKRKALALFLALCMVLSAVPAFAVEPKDGMGVAADVLFVRPVSLAAALVGTAMFFVALPFSIPSGSVEKSGKLLVSEPFEYTFARPLGDFDYKVGTAQMPKTTGAQ
jgi:hypothetical protein